MDASGISGSLTLGTRRHGLGQQPVDPDQRGQRAIRRPAATAAGIDWRRTCQTPGTTTYGVPVNPGSGLPGSVNLTITFTKALKAVSGSLTIPQHRESDHRLGRLRHRHEHDDPAALRRHPDLNGATLVTIALSNLNLQVGAGGYGMTLTGGTLGLAAITPGPIPPVNGSPSKATDNRLWLAVDGSIQTAALNLGANINSPSASNVTVEINEASGAYTLNGTSTQATALDWTKLPAAPDRPRGQPADPRLVADRIPGEAAAPGAGHGHAGDRELRLHLRQRLVHQDRADVT